MLAFTIWWVQQNWLLPHALAKTFSREKTQPPNLFSLFSSWTIQLCSIGRRLTQIFQRWKPNAGSLDYQTGPEWTWESDKHQSVSQSWSFTLLLQLRFSSAWSVRTVSEQWDLSEQSQTEGQSKEIHKSLNQTLHMTVTAAKARICIMCETIMFIQLLFVQLILCLLWIVFI